MTDAIVESPCIAADVCSGTVTLRLWTASHSPYDRRRNKDHFNQATLVNQTCTCSLSEDAIERLGIFARSGRRPFAADRLAYDA